MIIAQSENVRLRTFEKADIPNKVMWINDPENNAFLHYDIPICPEKTLAWFQAKDNSKRIDCVIEYDAVPVGLIGILSIDRQNNKAEFYISMGDATYKRKGIATEASRLLLAYCFQSLHLRKVYLNTDAENHVAHKLFEKVGFSREGYFVDDMIHRGKYIDRIRYAIVNKGDAET